MSTLMHHRIELFVSGRSAAHLRYARFVTALLERVLDDLDLEVIDVDERPDLAEDRVIVALPQIVRWFPLPIRRIIGEVYEADTLLMHLDLDVDLPSRSAFSSNG